MNKIYKVVWNAARNSYMVGSEFIRGSHSAGSRRISGRKLKGLVAAALLAGAILSPAGLMPASANWTGYATNGELEGEAYTRYQEDQKLEGDISDLQGQVNSQKSTIGNLKENDRKQNKDIAGLKQDVAANNRLDAVQSGAIIGGMIHDVVQDAAIDHNYEIDKAQGDAIKDLQEKTEGGMEKDRKQDAAIAGGIVHDAIQDGAIIGGMIHDEKQDAAIEMGIQKDEQQDAVIAGGIVHDAIQDGAIIGGMIHDEKQDAAIEMGIQKDEQQDAVIAGGIVHDAIQDGAIIGGMIHDEKQDAAIEMGIQKDEQQDSRLDDIEDKNEGQQNQIDNQQKELDAQKEWNEQQDGRLDNVEEEAKKHTTVSTADSNIQLTETVNDKGGRDYHIALNPDLKVDTVQAQSGSFGDIQINGKDENGQATNTINGLGNTTWDGTNITSGQAATEDQLQQAIQQTTEELPNSSVQYDKNEDGSVNKSSVTLGDGSGTAVHLGNVAAGKIEAGSTDAVNGGQLWNVQQDVNANTAAIGSLNSRVNTLDGRIDKVGANAAALAALHPLDFDPDDKWDFAAGYGNYGNENAMAVGAFYRPNEDTMFSVGGSFGTGENMVNAGVSFKIGQGNHVSTSRVAMAKEIETLRHNVAQLTALVNQLVGSEDQISNSMTTPFPDVPENHWAYETVEQMRERGIVEGYPDGTFGGDRQMTRYEFATIVYRALQKGIGMNEDIQRLVDEFKPELALIRVDTIAQDSEGNPTIERVRVNKA